MFNSGFPLRAVFCLSFVLSALNVNVALAQDGPVLQMALDDAEAIAGQSVALHLTILVPTWMPKPVEFPSFEIPNVRTRLPGRSTFPTSQNVSGETWSGVTRTYYLTPLVPGTFTIPPRALTVTYAEPGGISPLTATLETDAITISGTVPPGAESLRPFIAATALELEQDVSETTTGLSPGDSVTRTLTATITGASPFSLPALMPHHLVPGMAEYPESPVVEENEDGGALSGTRIESVTLMAQGGGEGMAPEVVVHWYNLESGEIETATVPSFEISVIAPPPPPPKPDYTMLFRHGLMWLIAAAVLFALVRRAWPPTHEWLKQREQIRLASEKWAFDQLKDQIRSRDYSAMLAALETWSQRLPGAEPWRDPETSAVLTEMGSARFGTDVHDIELASWKRLSVAVESLRYRARARHMHQSALAPLNPS